MRWMLLVVKLAGWQIGLCPSYLFYYFSPRSMAEDLFLYLIKMDFPVAVKAKIRRL
jgi:hypothetical protein